MIKVFIGGEFVGIAESVDIQEEFTTYLMPAKMQRMSYRRQKIAERRMLAAKRDAYLPFAIPKDESC